MLAYIFRKASWRKWINRSINIRKNSNDTT